MQSLIETLEDLIRIPTVSSLTNLPLIAYAERALHAAHWETRRYSYLDSAQVEKTNLVAAPHGQSLDDPAVDLAFVCHTDTVPYNGSWKEALDPVEEAGYVHGCGACDVKAFLACLLQAAAHVRGIGAAKIRIVLTADEEVGCIGAKHLLALDVLRPRRMVIGEPTLLHPARAGKGYCLATITVRGKEAHSAHPEQGASAILGSARLISALEQLAQQWETQQNALFAPAYTTFNIGTVHGGTAKNVIPGACTFLVEWRPIPGAEAATIPSAIQQVIDGCLFERPGLTCELTILRQQQGFETAAGSELVRNLEELSGRPASSIPFGSEASIFAAICEDIVVFGPGDMQSAHSERECVEIAQLEAAGTYLQTLMKQA